MDNSIISLIIACFALVVSIITGAYQIYRSNKEAALQREVTRSSLLTEIQHTINNHQKHRTNVERLLNEAKQNQRTELIPVLEKINKQNDKNEKISLETYDNLLFDKAPKPEFLERMRHFFVSMNSQSKIVSDAISKYHIKPINEHKT